ncbi:hypothetical protein NIES2135_60620 (plasmid) [Leptolyngbya boryana NIES-2135]|uniref:Methyltransferase domain-containing protein n=1 Tax=Leptolyngbya boryana NIES-2135 TaxID=1973484 RepID=A0A1Z4JQY5_LEPBY|nr:MULTISPECIES: class I SAM-dependent methyltransferase [Leptolyngbya]BAY59185.1 hypothetical protein NIES2135_60620 [Leptolyngbya boryana NIES-2135]MBD2372773.1 class I SAM-dependent methyltransferase [Leptolyngbya sp. FACHB-238]MBD2397475.1 class I SAM-dependent methyltransferase [Leptolyngbya sp. FACHB-239]MBD2403720.1 class I SAM-dependent methyltransferase [Leptolyngbya sp. FACHB-402]ULP33378.1 class I SAM-dependent methyltransferase [Leptolyngbya boryana IU 594]
MISLYRAIVICAISISLISTGCSSRTSDATVESAPAEAQSPPVQSPPLRSPDVVYVPTPPQVVERMLAIANVNQNDVLYDLGSGDGRIPITAVQQRGVRRAVGIDINPERISEANANAQQAGVTDRVRFLNQDLFQSNFSDATVVTLYLLPELNVKLRPQLLSQLKPGTRIVSHDFDMGEWKPEQTAQVEVDGRTHNVYFWTVPANPPANLR